MKLLMCRICLSDDTRLHSIVETHLEEMFESLTMMELVTEDSRPSLACDVCCSTLENCYELRRRSLRSEEVFTQLLEHEAQVKLEVMPDAHLSTEDVTQMSADDSADVKQEDAEDVGDDRGTSSESQEDAGTEYLIKCDPDVRSVMPIVFEEDSLKGDDVTQSSDSENSTSLADIKNTMNDVTSKDVAAKQDDTDLYHSALGLHTECDIPLDIVKEEPDDVDTDVLRIAAKQYREDTLPNYLKTTDHTIGEVEEQKREVKTAVDEIPVEKNKIVETHVKVDIKLRNNKQNNSKTEHNDAHKKMSENQISADKNINNSSSNKHKPLLCNTCQAWFRLKSDLIKHIRTHMGAKPYECNVCKKCFSFKTNLDRHIRTHTDEKPYECNVCKKCFRDKCYLDIHIRTHTGEKPFKCNVCKKRFSDKTNLNRHVRVHTSEKPYECNTCKKCFRNKGRLDIHIRTHVGEKPYECNVCKNFFSCKSNLDRHIRTHTEEKRYECNVCMKCFYHRYHLTRHIRTHKGEKSYKCDVCSKCFKRKIYFDKHICTHSDY